VFCPLAGGSSYLLFSLYITSLVLQEFFIKSSASPWLSAASAGTSLGCSGAEYYHHHNSAVTETLNPYTTLALIRRRICTENLVELLGD
jgi:hypothetical protein